MTYKEWEAELKLYLKSIDPEQSNEIIGYYREIYNDKLDAGVSEESILKDFGNPIFAAAKIIKENEDDEGERKEETKKGEEAVTPRPVSTPATPKKKTDGISVAVIVGWFFLTVLVLIPLFATLIGVIASLAAITVSGGAMVIAGALAAIVSPALFIFDYTVSGVLIIFGGALATAGLGFFILVSFYFITKYTVVSCYKVAKWIFKRRNK